MSLILLTACGHSPALRVPKPKAACTEQAALARRLLIQGDAALARLRAQDAVRECPQNAALHVLLGEALAAGDDLEEACLALERGRALGSRDPSLFSQLASGYDVLGCPEKVVEVALDFLKDHPKDLTVRCDLAGAWLLLNRPQEAVAALEEAHRLAPRDAVVLEALGQAYLAMGAPARARQVAALALNEEPHRIESRLLCAEALAAEKNDCAASRVVDALLRDHPRLEAALSLQRQLQADAP